MGRFFLSVASAARQGGREMNELSKAARDTEADVKESLRKADGDESLEDKAKNAADRVGNAVKDAGDKLHQEADEMSRESAYHKGRADEMARR